MRFSLVALACIALLCAAGAASSVVAEATNAPPAAAPAAPAVPVAQPVPVAAGASKPAQPAAPVQQPTPDVQNGVRAGAGNIPPSAAPPAAAPSAPSVSYVRDLTDDSFEHDTQASTGSTTGDWFSQSNKHNSRKRAALSQTRAPWCGHCKTLTPVWAALSAQVRAEQIPVTIAALDAVANTRTAKRFDIRGFPTLLYLSNGQTYRYNGERTQAALFAWLESRGWSNQAGVSVPLPVSATAALWDSTRLLSQEVVQLLWTKPGASAVLGCMGLMVGILASMLLYILWLEPAPQVYEIAQATPEQQAAAQARGARVAKTTEEAQRDAMMAVATRNAGAQGKKQQ